MSRTFKHVIAAFLVILSFAATLLGIALGGGGHGPLYAALAWLDITFVISVFGAISPLLVIAVGIGYHFGYLYLVRAGSWPVRLFVGLRTVGLGIGLYSLADKPSEQFTYFHWLPLGIWLLVNGCLIALNVVQHRTEPNLSPEPTPTAVTPPADTGERGQLTP